MTDENFKEERLTIRKKVHNVLEKYPDSRNSDSLFLQLYAKEYADIELPVPNLNNSIASILRERRKVQKIHPDLAPIEEVKEFRDSHAMRYRRHYGKENANDNLNDILPYPEG